MATKSEIARWAGEIRLFTEQMGSSAWEIGDRLLKIKESLEAGEWAQWVANNLPFSVSTARNLIIVRQSFKSAKHVRFEASVAYILAGRSVPEEARREAIDLAKGGEKVTVAQAREIVEKHRSPQEPTPWKEPVEESTDYDFDSDRERKPLRPQLRQVKPGAVDDPRVPDEEGYYWATHKTGFRMIVLLTRDGLRHRRAFTCKARESHDPSEFGDYSERIREIGGPRTALGRKAMQRRAVPV